MAGAAACRICLAVDARLLAVEGALLQVYEKITSNALHTLDGRPVAACYICHAQLNKCFRLMLTSARAEQVLNDILEKYSEISKASILAAGPMLGRSGPLVVSVVECFTTPAPARAVAEVKREPDDVLSAETADFPQPMHVTVSGVKDEDSGSDADDNSPVNSLRAETPVQGELREDGASAQTSGAEKQKRAKENVTNRNQQPRRPHECYVCQLSCVSKSCLIGHLRTHTGEKPYECDVCQKLFRQKGSLVRHVRTHTREKPYECTVCQRRFSLKHALIRHVKIHTGEKPYECKVCQRRFSQKSNLISHVKIHTGEKPYECTVCQRRFSQKSNLISHVKIHTGEKPYECNVCHRRFSNKSHLVRHVKIHTGEKPYECL